MNKKKVIQFLIAILVTIVSLYFAFKGIHIKDSLEIIKNIDIKYVIISVVISTSAIVLRALRWQCFIPSKKNIRKSTLIGAAYIGYMANNILPAKLGEVVRAYVVGEKEGISKTSIFASVITERLFDVFTGAIMLTIPILFIPTLPKTVIYAALVLFSVTIIGLLVLIFMVSKRDLAFKILNTMLSIIPKKISETIMTLAHHFIDGVGFRKDAKHIFLACFYTVSYWGCQVISALLLMKSFNINGSPALALFQLAASGFGFAVPSAPSGIGPIEWTVTFALTLAGIEKTLAASYAIVYHLIGILPIIAVGFLSLLLLGIDLKKATKKND